MSDTPDRTEKHDQETRIDVLLEEVRQQRVQERAEIARLRAELARRGRFADVNWAAVILIVGIIATTVLAIVEAVTV